MLNLNLLQIQQTPPIQKGDSHFQQIQQTSPIQNRESDSLLRRMMTCGSKICSSFFCSRNLIKIKDINGDRYEGKFFQGQPHGKGIKTFANGDRYEGEFFQGRNHGQGTCIDSKGEYYKGEFFQGQAHGKGIEIYTNGDRYEGEFFQDQPHGKGIFTFAQGLREEGNYFMNRKYGKGRYIFQDGGASSELEHQNDYPISNISHLSDSLFLQLLTQKFESFAPSMYCLGIMSDYLIKKGYEEVGNALKGGQQIRLVCIDPDTVRMEAVKIHQRMQSLNQPVLLALLCTDHAMGLQMRQIVSGFVDFEIYNSGEGLYKNHKQHPRIPSKFQTVWKKRIPLANLTPDQLESFLGAFANVDAAYHAIRNLPGAQDVACHGKSVIWKSAQKGNNCSLMWIFAYLKNNMEPQKYAGMRKQLFIDCIDASERAAVPNQAIIKILKEKSSKRLVKGKKRKLANV